MAIEKYSAIKFLLRNDCSPGALKDEQEAISAHKRNVDAADARQLNALQKIRLMVTAKK